MIRARVRRRPGRDSFMEDMLRSAGRSLGGGLVTRLREAVQDGVRQILRRLTTGALGTSMLITAAVFLLVAGVEGLKAASLPPWAAYLILGSVALVGGGLLLLKSRSRSDS